MAKKTVYTVEYVSIDHNDNYLYSDVHTYVLRKRLTRLSRKTVSVLSPTLRTHVRVTMKRISMK